MSKSYRSNWARVLCCCLAVLCASWPAWASSQCGTFQGPTGFVGTGTTLSSVAVADFNGDGKLDVVVTNISTSAGNNVFVLLGNGDGTFQTAVPLNTGGTNASAVAVGDFNGDGKPDLAVLTQTSSTPTYAIVVFLNTTPSGGALSFGSPHSNSIDSSPLFGGAGDSSRAIAVADIDGDGKLDLAIMDNSALEVLLGNGDGTFKSFVKSTAVTETVVESFALIDLNGDGKLDLVVGGLGDSMLKNQVQIEMNQSTAGSVSFSSVTGITLTGVSTPFILDIVGADFNGDGKPDLALADTNNGLTVLLNTTAQNASTPSFQTPANFTSYTANLLSIADIDGDGKPDIVGIVNGTNSTTGGSTLINTTVTNATTPTFTAGTTIDPIILNTSNGANAIAMADFNEDGQLDIVITNGFTSGTNQNVLILLGLGGNTNTMIAAPSPALFGAIVTFTATVKAGTLQAGTTPTGNVQFTDNNVNVGSPATLSGSAGTATAFITNSTLALGSHPLQAVYTGDANFCAGTSVAFNETISNQHSSTTTLSTSANPSNAGQTVTFTATVISSGGPTPTGTVTFKDGASTLGTGNLNGSGMATLSTSSLTAGAHSITASYPGDVNTLASNSSTLTQNVQDFTLGANTQTLTVKAGQSGMVTITLTPEGGFNSTVQLSCGSLPAESTCSFNPASLTPDGAAVTSTLTFNTTAASALLTPATPWKGRGSLYAWLSLPSIGLVGLVWAVGAKRNRKELKQVVLPLLLLFLAVVAAQGCGGNSSGGNGNHGTPPGTSAVSVTVSGAGLSHSLTLTITVTQ